MVDENFLSYHRSMPPTTDMTVPQAARALGCSPPTVRALVADGLLPATAIDRGKRTFLTIKSAEVDDYLRKHGEFSRRARRPRDGGTEHQLLLAEIKALREAVDARGSGGGADVEVVALREALHLQRAAMAALLEADDARSEGVRHLREAMQSFDAADLKRRRAINLLDEVIGSLTVPGNAEALSD